MSFDAADLRLAHRRIVYLKILDPGFVLQPIVVDADGDLVAAIDRRLALSRRRLDQPFGQGFYDGRSCLLFLSHAASASTLARLPT